MGNYKGINPKDLAFHAGRKENKNKSRFKSVNRL